MMKKIALLVAAAGVFFTTTTQATLQEYKYSCEREPAPPQGIWQHYDLTVSMDLENAALNSATVNGNAITNWDYDTKLMEFDEGTHVSGHAHEIAGFSHTLRDNDKLNIEVYGAVEGVKVADVIFTSTSQSGDWCYRYGSKKEVAMTGLRQSHNTRILNGG